MLVKVPSKAGEAVINALIRNPYKLPKAPYKSLTWDRGTEMAGRKRLTVATDMKVYMCDPHQPWQRGSNENANGLLRRYLSKVPTCQCIAQAELNAVARRLKERLRKTLDYETPAELFPQTIASTGSICHRTEAPKVTWSFPVRRETCLFDTASGRSILNITASYFRPPSGIRNTVGCGRREWHTAPRGSQGPD